MAIRIWNTNSNDWVGRTVYLSIPDASGETPGTGDDPSTGDTPGSGTDPGTGNTPGTGGNTPGTGTLSDGTYTTTVTSSAAMFKIVKCELTVVNGQIRAQITLSGTGYDMLYMGTAAAAAGDSANWISPDRTADYTADDGSAKTGTVFTIPVSALDTPISVAAHGSKWYDRTLTFNSADLQKTSGDDETVQPSDGSSDGKPADTEPEVPTPAEESQYESDLSGSTSAVDNSTTLADGVYTPDTFSWSGGTGRLSISCTQVTVTNGRAYATLAFSSTNIGYVKASGNIYYPTVSGGRSLFTIPVRLNANNTIIGMTTAMSAAHEVAYNIYVYIAAAAASDRGEDVNTIGFGDENSARTLDDEAPEVLGFVYDADNENEVAYAETFRLFFYDQGVRLLEVDMTGGTARDPEAVGNEEAEASEEAETVSEDTGMEEEGSSAESAVDTEIYMEDVVYYLLVPEGVEVPAGLDKEVVIITIPAENVYASSEEAMAALETLDLLGLLTATDEEPAEEEDGEASDAPDEAPAFAGSWNDPNFRELIRSNTQIAFLSDMILPRIVDEDDRNADNEDLFYEADADNLDAYFTGEDGELLSVDAQTDRMAEITEYFATLGIPVIVDRSADEDTDLAAAEWIKVYGVLFGREDEANALFGEAVEAAVAAGEIEAPDAGEAA
ncbi:MAG: hypothetical protein IKD88_04510 [Lachnospiraceae bacterium]|nr:hypothetical protein [Lachnospiraceae bacterium]